MSKRTMRCPHKDKVSDCAECMAILNPMTDKTPVHDEWLDKEFSRYEGRVATYEQRFNLHEIDANHLQSDLEYAQEMFKQAITQRIAEAKVRGMQQAKSRVLRRTEIPKDARNPTRDAIVILGEEIADIIQHDIEKLTSKPTSEGESNG